MKRLNGMAGKVWCVKLSRGTFGWVGLRQGLAGMVMKGGNNG